MYVPTNGYLNWQKAAKKTRRKPWWEVHNYNAKLWENYGYSVGFGCSIRIFFNNPFLAHIYIPISLAVAIYSIVLECCFAVLGMAFGPLSDVQLCGAAKKEVLLCFNFIVPTYPTQPFLPQFSKLLPSSCFTPYPIGTVSYLSHCLFFPPWCI